MFSDVEILREHYHSLFLFLFCFVLFLKEDFKSSEKGTLKKAYRSHDRSIISLLRGNAVFIVFCRHFVVVVVVVVLLLKSRLILLLLDYTQTH